MHKRYPRMALQRSVAGALRLSCSWVSRQLIFHHDLPGMAIRLAIDFGLHISAKPYVDAGSMSVEEARGRSVAFWGAFTTDQ